MNEDYIYEIVFLSIKKNYKKYLLVFFVGFLLTFFTTFLVDKKYTTTISLIPNSTDKSGSALNLLVQDFGLNMGDSSIFPISDLVLSNSILNEIYNSSFQLYNSEQKITLSELWRMNQKSFLSTILFRPAPNNVIIKYNTLLKLKNRTTVNYDRRSNITTISVTIEDPLVAKQLAYSFYDNITIFINENINKIGSVKKTFISEQIESNRAELLVEEEKLRNFLDQNKSRAGSPLLAQKYKDIVREIGVKENIYVTLMSELESAKIDEVKNSLKLFIIEQPEAIPIKTHPKRLRFSIIVGFAFFLLVLLRKNIHNFNVLSK